MRNLIYKIQLNLEDGRTPEIFIATRDKEKLPELIEKNKHWFTKKRIDPVTKTWTETKVLGWKFIEEIMTLAWTEDKYNDEISHCDVVDEIE